jgi:hypothetical protein
MQGFLARVKPLMDVGDVLSATDKEFDEQWEKGIFPGWEKEKELADDAENGQATSSGIYCAACAFRMPAVFIAALHSIDACFPSSLIRPMDRQKALRKGDRL